ncbi:hypothetical protein MSAS_19150 [Mycobacterium saskatchewanense]|uniref:Uncharacterized protein n=1 Tax=Mycobacterium saskatchewanense TaxID=220927 RepID=A0AAJ3TVD2_9MYCO|nr:hypothetical protein [Mycobacterium saskatchewanense]ORW72100.1 hypothetical protein AWC23_11245 [Mycobacterium saskatchewanense]BBX62741.1 hypothetical protein MSAS_19150 [Mycobacterium saskatchewanense]
MAIEQRQPPSSDKAFADEIERAERGSRHARERAAMAGISTARSFDESARRHEELARVQDETVRQGVSHFEMHRESAVLHRKAAAEDRHLAELKRNESEPDLS